MLRALNEWDRMAMFDYLNRNEEETDFLIGNILQSGIANRNNILRCGDYYGYFEGNDLRGIIVFYNMGSCVPHFESAGAVIGFAELMITRNFSMILGADRIVRPVFEIVRHYRPLREFEECDYSVNSSFKPYKSEGCEFINVCGDSGDEILKFVRKAYMRGFGAEHTIESTKLLLSQRNAEEDFIILLRDNIPLAQACIQAFTCSTNQIGAVYTLEEERGKGYAKAVVSELCERIISRGKLPTLIVNKLNTPAINAYKSLGFGHRSDYLIIRLNN